MIKFSLHETRGMFTPRSSPYEKEDWQTAGRSQVTSVRNRVRVRGEGSSGRSMPAYSSDYARHRSLRGKQTVLRSLTFTGKLLDSLRVISFTKSGCVYGFSTERGKTLAEAHGKRSEFLSPTQTEVFRMRDLLRQRLGLRLKTFKYTVKK